MFGQCAGAGFNSTIGCCNAEASCVAKNGYYAQCLLPKRAQSNVDNGWNGAVVACGEDIPDMTTYKELDSSCADSSCANKWDKCGGTNMTTSLQCCGEGVSCVVKNWAFAQCIPDDRIDSNTAAGWDGRTLTCEEMPSDLYPSPPPPPMPTVSRRLLSGFFSPSRHLTEVCSDSLAFVSGRLCFVMQLASVHE